MMTRVDDKSPVPMFGLMSFTGDAGASDADQCTSNPVIVGLLSVLITPPPMVIVCKIE